MHTLSQLNNTPKRDPVTVNKDWQFRNGDCHRSCFVFLVNSFFWSWKPAGRDGVEEACVPSLNWHHWWMDMRDLSRKGSTDPNKPYLTFDSSIIGTPWNSFLLPWALCGDFENLVLCGFLTPKQVECPWSLDFDPNPNLQFSLDAAVSRKNPYLFQANLAHCIFEPCTKISLACRTLNLMYPPERNPSTWTHKQPFRLLVGYMLGKKELRRSPENFENWQHPKELSFQWWTWGGAPLLHEIVPVSVTDTWKEIFLAQLKVEPQQYVPDHSSGGSRILVRGAQRSFDPSGAWIQNLLKIGGFSLKFPEKCMIFKKSWGQGGVGPRAPWIRQCIGCVLSWNCALESGPLLNRWLWVWNSKLKSQIRSCHCFLSCDKNEIFTTELKWHRFNAAHKFAVNEPCVEITPLNWVDKRTEMHWKIHIIFQSVMYRVFP